MITVQAVDRYIHKNSSCNFVDVPVDEFSEQIAWNMFVKIYVYSGFIETNNL